MISPFTLPPHPLAQAAAKEVTDRVHAYMQTHPESELHRQGKMFGVLVYSDSQTPLSAGKYLSAFSAQLDGTYFHEGFVPPVYAMQNPPIGKDKSESRRLQRLLFAQYCFVNGNGESKNLLELFADETPIVPAEEWFNQAPKASSGSSLPPSGAGECCAPKLLQYALTHGLTPFALAEFWVGAAPANEIRSEGTFYTPCSGRCVPILRHMLRGVDVEPEPAKQTEELCRQIAILYEDEYLYVVNKPAGLLSVPGKNGEPSVAQYLSARPVHRLDQDTSGLLVLAKTPQVYTALQSCFQRRDILKRYEAVVQARSGSSLLLSSEKQEGDSLISLPLLPNPYDRPRQMVNKEHGKPSITRYTVRERRTDNTFFVDFYPLTGRTHQLRVHAAHAEGLNAPIAGDRLYGTRTDSSERLMLHAAEISFPHPVTNKQMHFCIPSGF